MKIYKIAQSSPFNNWFTSQLLTLTDNHKKPLDNYLDHNVISSIVNEFFDLPEEELKKVTLEDLYVINFLKGVQTGLPKWLGETDISQRVSGLSSDWLQKAIKKFPELIQPNVIPALIKSLEKNPRGYRDLPDEIKQLLPEELVASIERHYLDALLNGHVGYPELPEDFKERLSLHSEAWYYVINGYTEAIMRVDNPHPLFIVQTVPEDIRQDVLDNIAKIRNENAQNIPN